jgi:hypothetical protein
VCLQPKTRSLADLISVLADVKGEPASTFHIVESKNGRTKISVRTPNYDPFDKWLKYSDFDGMFLESFPMQGK